jgi:glycine betaine/proline transport system permease protein
VIGVVAGFLLIANQGLWLETIQTLALVVCATATSMLIGVPLGIFLGHRERLYRLILPLLDLMQTLPTFIYLIPTLVLFGLGMVPGLVATVVFSVPTVIRLTYLGISSVPPALQEAGAAFGASRHQLLWKIEIPSAMPTIMEGLTQSIMLSLSMVVVAALVGADGLGKPVVRALAAVNVPLGLEAGISIVVLAIILDRTLKLTSRRSSR